MLTLASANNLAVVLRELGQLDQARQLQEDTFARRRRVLGDDHPSTLASANNLAVVLRELGDLDGATRANSTVALARERGLHHDITLTIIGSSSDDEAQSLRHWLGDLIEGNVRLVASQAEAGHKMGSLTDSIAITLTPTGLPSLVRALMQWIHRRRSDVRVVLTSPDGRTVEVAAQRLTEAQVASLIGELIDSTHHG